MKKLALQIGALLGTLSVIIGAFGAHALEKFLTETNRTDTFETAVKYQFYTALALLVVGILGHLDRFSTRWLNWSARLFMIGTVVFSGSLYLICFTGVRAWGAVAPIGGLCMILGWLSMFWAVTTDKE
jgi:uncharacterized membrane protein YgdD (TMEM256/DUF423 family)